MEKVNPEEQVSVIEKSITIFQSAPNILLANQERSRKALSVGERILTQWHDAWNTEDAEVRIKALAAADERSNQYLVNCNKALVEEKESRAAITQMMDEFRKMFTSAENEIDKTKPNTIPSKVQNWRDQYVSEMAAIEKRKKAEAEAKAAKEKAKIDYKTSLNRQISSVLNKAIADKKLSLNNSFNAITLETFEQKAVALRNLNCSISKSKVEELLQGITGEDPTGRLTDQEEQELNREVLTDYPFDGFYKMYSDEILDVKDSLISRLPSKKYELDEIKRQADEAARLKAEALEKARIAEEKRQADIAMEKDKKEKERLEALNKELAEREAEELRKLEAAAEAERLKKENEVKARAEAERLKIAQEAEERDRQSQLQIDMQAQAEHTMNLFDQEGAAADIGAKPEARTGYEIQVNHQAGYAQIFQFWFENEGKNLGIDKMEKTSLGQMKAYCEKVALKKGTKIESKMLTYVETFKAVNRKNP